MEKTKATESKPLSAYLPLVFSDQVTVGQYTARCKKCSHPVGSEHLVGTAVKNTPELWELHLAAACPKCAAPLKIDQRLHINGVMEKMDENGLWWAAGRPRLSLQARIFLLIRRIRKFFP